MKKTFFLMISVICALFVGTNMFAQSRSVKVTVSDAQGPVIGAGVVIKGTTTGSVTDIDGVATLSGVSDATVLQITCIGYETQEVTVGSQSAISVTLAEETELIEETVVVGYGVQKKESLTSAVTQIAAEDITNTKHADAIVSLQGKVPGLLIRENSGKPGQFNTDLSLRGYGTPMIVVDGVVRSGSTTTRRNTTSWSNNIRSVNQVNDMSALQEINPDDIESISVLKDAAATIYGLGAANGVIVITTKKGKSQKPSINYSASLNLTKPVTIREVEDWTSFMKWDNAMADVAKMSHRFSDDMIKHYENGDEGYDYFDWFDLTHKNFAKNMNHNLSISGGSDKIRYYLGLGYTEENSILKSNNNEYHRYNVSGNVTANITDNLEARYQTSIRSNTTLNPSDPDLDWNMFYYLYAQDPTVGPTVKGNPAHITNGVESTNVVALLNKDLTGYSDTRGLSFQNTIDLTYSAPWLKGLKLQATGAYDFSFNKLRTLVKQFDVYDYNTDVYVTTKSLDQYAENWSDNSRLYGKVQANYSKKIGEHNFQATLAAEMTNLKNSMIDASRFYSADKTKDNSFYTHDIINQGVAGTQENSGTRNERMTAGYVSRVSYDYKGKYLAEVMARYDGTYIYAPGHRWGLFPSYSLGWRVSEEDFFKAVFPKMNNFKLRWSDGKTGSTQGSAYAYIGGYTQSGSWVFQEGASTKGYHSTTVENTILSWADVRMLDFGVDFEYNRGVIGGTFDWYKRITDGTAATRSSSLPDFYAVSLPSENLNKSEHTGIEATLYHRGNFGKFNYRVQGNLTFYRARTTYDIKEDPSNPDRNKYSSAMNYYKSASINRWSNARSATQYHWAGGQFQSLTEISQSNVLYDMGASTGGNAGLFPGQYKLVDRDGDGYITSEDAYYVWPESNSPLQYGFNISGSYENFDFSLVFSGASAKSKGVSLSAYTGFGYLYQLPTHYSEDCWHVANYGDDPWNPATEWKTGYWPALARVSQATQSPNETFGKNQPYNFADATYLRLKSLELGYRLPSKVLSKAGVRNVRVFFNGGNLLTFCNKALKYVDPESSDQGRAGGTFNINKTYNFGVSLNF